MLITSYLSLHHTDFQELMHRPAACGSRVAESLHVPGRMVAKAVLTRADDTAWLVAVLPSTHRLDLEHLAKLVSARSIRLATLDEMASLTRDCEYGVMPPFGSLYGIPTVAESSLAGSDSILCATNYRHRSVRLSVAEFAKLESPITGWFAFRECPRSARRARRRAG